MRIKKFSYISGFEVFLYDWEDWKEGEEFEEFLERIGFENSCFYEIDDYLKVYRHKKNKTCFCCYSPNTCDTEHFVVDDFLELLPILQSVSSFRLTEEFYAIFNEIVSQEDTELYSVGKDGSKIFKEFNKKGIAKSIEVINKIRQFV